MQLRPVAVDRSGHIPGGVVVDAQAHAAARRPVRTDAGITLVTAGDGGWGDSAGAAVRRSDTVIPVRQFAAH